jgi:hypothetical protein
MKKDAETGSGAMIYECIPSFIKAASVIQYLAGGIHRHKQHSLHPVISKCGKKAGAP